MIDDDSGTKTLLISALSANPFCLATPRGRRVAINGDGAEWQALVAVSHEPQGLVYGHLFADRNRSCWRALLIFSSVAVMADFDRESVTAYQRLVVRGMQCEPLYSWTPGDVSLLAPTRQIGTLALVDLIARYSPRLVEPPLGMEDRPTLDGAIFDAYYLQTGLR